MNNIKFLPLAEMFEEYQFRVNEEVQKLQKILVSKARSRHHSLIRSLGPISIGEAGSDGEEEVLEELNQGFNEEEHKLSKTAIDKVKAECRTLILDQFCTDNTISSKLSWLPFQLAAVFSTWIPIKGDDELYSAPLTAIANTFAIQDKFAMGALMLAKCPRGLIFKGAPKGNQQYKSAMNPLVPTVLASFKQNKGISYSEWSKEGIESLVDSDLAAAMLCKYPEELSTIDFILIRNKALTVQTGARAGKQNNPATCYTQNGIAESAIGHLPKLARFMCTQTWAAHPENRTEYMILDPSNWDNMPEPLISSEVFKDSTSKGYTVVGRKQDINFDNIPWN